MVIIYIIINATNVAADLESLDTGLSIESVPTSKILEKIKNGEDVKYDHVKIVGDLDISDLSTDSYYEVNCPIQINESEIMGQIKFSDVVFTKTVDFMQTTFVDDVKFENVSFRENAIFSQAYFAKNAYFMEDNFYGDAHFIESVFDRKVNFDNSYFCGNSFFGSSTLKNHASYINVDFSGYADFGSLTFEKGAGFRNTNFGNYADFKDAKFGGDAEFWNAKFDKDAKFTSAKFEDDAEFWGAEFLQNAQFDGAVFNKNAFFNDNPLLELKGARFEGDLILDDAVIHSMNLKNAEFGGGRISLNNSDFNRLKTNWTALKGPLYYNGQVYLALIKNFKEQEQFEDADDCYYDYRYESKDGWLDYVSWISCGFGVRPQYTIFLSAALILLFGIAFWLGEGIQTSPVPDEKDAGKRKVERGRRSWEDLGEALFFSLLVFTFQARGDWRASGKFRLIAVVEGVLGIGLIGLFVVTLANIMIRY